MIKFWDNFKKKTFQTFPTYLRGKSYIPYQRQNKPRKKIGGKTK